MADLITEYLAGSKAHSYSDSKSDSKLEPLCLGFSSESPKDCVTDSV